MTKTEKNAMQNFFNRYGEISQEADRIFKVLQEENKKVNGKAWCNAETNAEELLQAGVKWAHGYYQKYVGLLAQKSLMLDFGQELANLNFWKDDEAMRRA